MIDDVFRQAVAQKFAVRISRGVHKRQDGDGLYGGSPMRAKPPPCSSGEKQNERRSGGKNTLRSCFFGCSRLLGCAYRGGFTGGSVAMQALQVAAQFRGGLVTQIAIFFESLGDDAIEFRWKFMVEAQRRRGSSIQK